MKIGAIRVAECGRFTDPVALEGLSGGLDVLVGPNEAGKSTLLRALKLALNEKHTSTKAEIRELQPYRGGAPLVEVELALEGEIWRLRKRFISQRTAELKALGSGRIWRGGDAENELERLLGGTGKARFDLLWLSQGAMLSDPAPSPDGQDLVRAALAAEIAAVAGGETIRRMRAGVQARLGELVTRKSRRGRYKKATEDAERARQELAEARRRQDVVEALVVRLGSLAARAAEIDAADASRALATRLADAQAALKGARESAAARDRAAVGAAEAKARYEAAVGASRRFSDAAGELTRLLEQDAVDRAEAETAVRTLGAIQADRVAGERVLGAAHEELTEAEAALTRVVALEKHRALAEQLRLARSAQARGDAERAVLAGLPRDGEALAEARRLSARIGEGAVRLEAQSAKVTLDYLPGADRRVHAIGAPLADGVTLIVDKTLVLDIEGVGRITVEPGQVADRARLEEQLGSDRRRLGRLLAAGGSGDLAEFETRHEQARHAEGGMRMADAEVTARAPGGIASLAAAVADLATKASIPGDGMLGAEGLGLVGVVEERVREKRAAVQTAMENVRSVEASRERLLRDEAARTARVAERDKRRAEVGSALPPASQLASHRASLEAAAATASQTYDEALRTLSAWQAKAPDRRRLDALEAEEAAVRDAIDRARRDAGTLANEKARVEGALEEKDGVDVAADVAALEAANDEAAARLLDIEEEVAALTILDEELGVEIDRVKGLFVTPVLGRIGPFRDLVMPDAEITLGEGYRAAGVARGDVAEAMDRLSDGTREQIAILVRLGLGRLLADRGQPVPLVLDDALVYSDDQRMAAMQGALALAATAHQVIVLTCREQSFKGLAGKRLALAGWRPD